ncbi:tetratricopeptide repeat protein [Prevotella sp. HCN-7019]|uniref:tetratricopeptide repeat protein n=1 Tax=Prevotella sp. HCN-7019 TaxID=3134668 RepID=UPI0030BFD6DB
MVRADSLMEIDMDSAPSALRMLDSMSPHVPYLSKSRRMRYELLRAKAMNKSNVYFRSDSTMKEVAAYYSHHGTPNEKMMAWYLLGCVYRDLGEAPAALEYYQKAAACADTTAEDCDYSILNKIYAQSAIVLHSQKLIDEELDMWHKAEYCGKRAHNIRMAISAFENTVRIYYALNDYNKVMQISDSASSAYLNSGYKDKAARAIFIQIDIYLKRGDIKNAEACLHKYEKYGDIFSSPGNVKPGLELYYYYKGLSLLASNRVDSAEYYFRKMLTGSARDEKEAAYRGLLSVYRSRRNSDSVFHYARLYCDANDSSWLRLTSSEAQRVQSLYRYTRNRQQAELREREVSELRLMIVFLSVISLIVVLELYMWHRRRSFRMKSLLLEKNRMYSDLLHRSGEISRELSAALGENSRLASELEASGRRLRAELDKMQDMSSTDADWASLQKLMESDLIKNLHDQAAHGRSAGQKDWSRLNTYVENRYPRFLSFINNLGSNSLSQNEKKVAILIKLHFLSSEISCLLDISPQNLSNIRRRLNLKLFGSSRTSELDRNIRDCKN